MKLKLLYNLFFSFLFLLFSGGYNLTKAQAIIKFGGTATYITMSNGSAATPIYLVVGNSANTAIQGTSLAAGYVISEGDYNFLKWNMGATNASYTLPFGYSTTAYLPFTYNKTSGNANLAASTRGTAATDNLPLANGVTNMNPSGAASDAGNMAVDRWWRLKQENGVSAPVADLTFSYRGAERTIGGLSCGTDLVSAQYWGTNWVTPVFNPGTTCTGGAVETSLSSGVNVFTASSNHPFILVKNTAPLPVEFISFDVGCDNANVKITWSTASEQNSSHFLVERSSDGTNFSSIATVVAAGNSSTVKNYSSLDSDPLSGLSYYRITQVDFNGASMTTEAKTITSCENDNVTVWGNDGVIYTSINTPEDRQYLIEVYNLLGQKLYAEPVNAIKGNNRFKLEPSELASGIYLVQVISSVNKATEKIFVRSNY